MGEQYTAKATQDVATTASGLGAGAGDHLPIGDYGGMDYRSAIRFAIPPGWTGWKGIISAYLRVYISDHQHVGPKNSSINCSRMSVPWTKDQGSQDCESGFSGSNNTQYDDIGPSSIDRFSFSSGTTANAAKLLNVTDFIKHYWVNNSNPVFVFDNNGADQYTELWSLGKTGTTYDAVLTINYETVVAPNPPTLTSPSATDPVVDSTPTLAWTPDTSTAPQTAAEVQLYDAGGVAIGLPVQVAGAATTYDVTPALLRGTTYQWAVRTQNSAGWGLYSTKRNLTIKALPVVTITPIRFMDWDPVNHRPRLRVRWECDQTQTSYQVDAGTYHSGVKTLTTQDHLLDTLDISDNVAVTVSVTVTSPDGLTGTASRSFTPRYGLTTHRKTLAGVPTNWKNPVIASTVPDDPLQGKGQLIIEYGTSVNAGDAVPTAWSPSLSDVPKRQHLHWRAWFIPNGNASPALDSIDIPYDQTVAAIDKWGTTKGVAALTGGWSIDTGEYVYGSRSISVEPSGAATYCYAFPVALKKGRAYILTGLMKSRGNSGACIELQSDLRDAGGNPVHPGTVLKGGGVRFAEGTDMRTTVLVDPLGTEWFTADKHDVVRYTTPVYEAKSDGEVVYVVLKANGVAGSKAWFDAIKLEESTVATAWSPGAVGATIIDAGGVQIDARAGGVFRYRGTADPVTNPRALVEGGAQGLKFGGDVEVYSPSAGDLYIGGSVRGSVVASNGDTYTGGYAYIGTAGGYDTYWRRSGASVMATDGHLIVGGVIVNQNAPQRVGGTSFPAGASAGDRFWRTDLGLEFYWNGARWLSSQVFQARGSPAFDPALSASGGGRLTFPFGVGWSDALIVASSVTFFASAGTALSASHKWVVTFNMGGSAFPAATLNIDSGALSVGRSLVVSTSQLVGAARYADVVFTKTGTPGNLLQQVEWHYRAVAT